MNQWRSQDVFIGVAHGGASNQSGVAQKYSLFQYKNVIDYKVLHCLSA